MEKTYILSYLLPLFAKLKILSWKLSTTGLITLFPLIILIDREITDREALHKKKIDQQVAVMKSSSDIYI